MEWEIIKHSVAPSLPPHGDPNFSSPSNTLQTHRHCSLPWRVMHLNCFVAAVAAGGGLHGMPNIRASGLNSHEVQRGQSAAVCSNPPRGEQHQLERSRAVSRLARYAAHLLCYEPSLALFPVGFVLLCTPAAF